MRTYMIDGNAQLERARARELKNESVRACSMAIYALGRAREGC